MKRFKSIIARDSKKFKRIVFFGLIIFGLIILIFPNVTYAGLATSFLGEQAYTKNISDLIKMISHIVYVFIWPCLVIAGTALDNSLIYGSFLHLDAALWNIWNIMKNFANFALGFLFVFTIVVNLFKGADGKTDPMQNAVGTIKSTLLAGVLVQMSWFIVAVLIDLSTILIYAVGGLPLSLLGTYNKDVADVPIMKLNTEISDSNFNYYYSYGGHNYSPCLLVNKEGDVEDRIQINLTGGEYIAGRERLYLSEGATFETGYCTLNGFLYKYEEYPGFFCNLEGGTPDSERCYNPIGDTLIEKNSDYAIQIRKYLEQKVANDTGLREDVKNSCFLINAYGIDYQDVASCTPLCSGYGAVPYTGDVFATTTDGFTLENLLNKSKGWVGPFVTMYSSILNYQELVMDPGNQSTVGTLFGFIINTFFALILFLPMAVLAILLVVRVGYLWIVVAISPILMLGYAFEKTKGDSPLKKISEIFGKKFNIKNVLMQIFAPVIVVFAVSLCIIFLSTIYTSKPDLENASKDLSAFGIQCVEEDVGNEGNAGNACVAQNKKCSYSIMGLVTIKMNAQNYNHGKDMFVWVLMEFLATGIVWFFIKFAIDFIGKFSEKNLGKDLMGTAEKYVTTMPILRLPGMDERVGLHAIGIGEGNNGKLLNKLNQKVLDLTDYSNQEAALEARFGKKKKTETETSISGAVDYIRKNPNVGYKDLDQRYKDALNIVGYNANNFDSIAKTIRDNGYENVISAGSTISTTTSTGKTNAEAVRYTSSQMDIAVKSIDGWKSWAASVVGGSIELLDGVFMVDYMSGTQKTGNPQFRIVSREQYEKEHFGNPVQSLSVDDYNKMQDEDKKALKKHFDELQEEIKQLEDINNKLSNNETLSDDEKKQKDSLEHQTNGIANLKKQDIENIIKNLQIS